MISQRYNNFLESVSVLPFFRHFSRGMETADALTEGGARREAVGGPGLFDCWIFIRTPHGGKCRFPKTDLIRTVTMSNTPLKCIMLIIKYIYFGDLLDCPLFATKPPFHPKSSRCSFSEYLYTKHFPKYALLDLLRSLMPRGKCTVFAEKSGTFLGRRGCVLMERSGNVRGNAIKKIVTKI